MRPRWLNLRSLLRSSKKGLGLAPAAAETTPPDVPNKWNLCVVNLTQASNQYTSNLDKAIASVNYQVEKDFEPEWQVGGKLLNMTADFNLHLTRYENRLLTGPVTFERFSKSLVDWIVSGDHGLDWSDTGIVYVTDPYSGFGGVHMDEKMQDLDIPYALVGVQNENWPVVLSHEVLELLADPWGSRFVRYSSTDPVTYLDQGTNTMETKVIPNQDWIVEVCDSVEADDDGYKIAGIPVSNFISQAYYDTKATSNIDFRNLLERTNIPKFPFPIRWGGYLSFFDADTAGDLYQIKWSEGKEPEYTKVPLSNAKISKQLMDAPKINDHHRILKYWNTRKRAFSQQGKK